MPLTQILFFVSVVVWLGTPLTQFRSKYFPFFLVLSLIDPITYLLRLHLHWPPSLFYPSSILLVVLLIGGIKKLSIIVPTVAVMFLFTFWLLPEQNYIRLINGALDFVLLLLFSRDLFKIIIDRRAINLLIVLLITYISLGVYKNIYSFFTTNFIIAFFLTSYIQIFIGLMFWFIKFETKEFKLPLNK